MFSFANVTCLKRRTLVVKIGAKAHGGGFGVPRLHISFSDTSLVWVDLQFPDLAARSPGHRWGTCCFGILTTHSLITPNLFPVLFQPLPPSSPAEVVRWGSEASRGG